MKMTTELIYAGKSPKKYTYKDYGADTLINYERDREESVCEQLRREFKMTQENQVVHDRKIATAGTMYRDLPPWAQEFVDNYRESMVRLGRINGTGPDELLRFIASVKELVDKTADNIFETAKKGAIGDFHRGSGV